MTKYQIKALCKDCTFKGNYDEVFKHCAKEKHGGYGQGWVYPPNPVGNSRCNMTLDKNDTIKAIFQASLKEWFSEIFSDGKTDKAMISKLWEYYAIERLPQQIEGDDIDDVLDSLKGTTFALKLKAFLESVNWFDEQPILESKQPFQTGVNY